MWLVGIFINLAGNGFWNVTNNTWRSAGKWPTAAHYVPVSFFSTECTLSWSPAIGMSYFLTHANSVNNSNASETIECLADSYTSFSTTPLNSILYHYEMQMGRHPPTSRRDKSVILCITTQSLGTNTFLLQCESHGVNLRPSLSHSCCIL